MHVLKIYDIYIYPDTAKHQSKPQGYIRYSTLWSNIALWSADIALRSDIAPADYKKTTLTFSKVPTIR